MRKDCFISLWLLAAAAMSACTPARDGGPDTEFRERIVALNAALARADTALVRPQLADDLRWIVGSTGTPVGKAQLLAAAGTPQNPPPRFDVDSVVIRRIGNVVFAEYHRTDHRRVGVYEFPTAWRILEVYVSDGKRWQLTRHMMTYIHVPSADPMPLDSTSLAPFVGRYEIHPDYIDNVHFEGRNLVATATGQTEGARLVPVSQTAFIPDGVGQLMMFERDRVGHVTGYVQAYPNGVVVRARRLE